LSCPIHRWRAYLMVQPIQRALLEALKALGLQQVWWHHHHHHL